MLNGLKTLIVVFVGGFGLYFKLEYVAISGQVGAVTLGHAEKWEEIVGFTPNRVGDKQKVEFLLYKPGQSEAYRKLLLWLDIR